MKDIFKLPVFEAADVFPMMADDELAELAEDIAANGLREPLVTADVDGRIRLVDGRNRRAACKIAGVIPQTRELNGEDPTAFVLSANVHRRNLTTGQRAMAIAMLSPEPEDASERGKKGGRGKKAATSGGVLVIPHQRLADARTVLAYSPELAQAVMRGERPLRAALDETRLSQGGVRNDRARLTKLRDQRPDLAELVSTEAMPLDEAWKKATEEAEERKQQRWAATMNLIDSIRSLDRSPETAPDEIQFYDAALAESRGEKITPARLRRASEYLGRLAEAMEELQ